MVQLREGFLEPYMIGSPEFCKLTGELRSTGPFLVHGIRSLNEGSRLGAHTNGDDRSPLQQGTSQNPNRKDCHVVYNKR